MSATSTSTSSTPAVHGFWTISRKFLDVDREMFRHSWATLTEYGNIASAVVLDALRRLFEEGPLTPRATGLVAGFGPGITAEMALGTWRVDAPINLG